MELPDVLKIQDNSSPYDSVLYTHKTQPVTFSQSQTRFEIPKAGIMSSTAIVEWSFLPNPLTATQISDGGMFPLSVGSSSCIRRAVLSTQSGRIIMDNREFNLKQICEKSFRDGDYNHFVAPYLDLSWTTYRYADPVLEPAKIGTLRSCGVPKTPDGVEVLDGSAWSVPDIIKLAGVDSPVAKNADFTAIQQTRVSLQELFPFLYNLQLPTIMMEQLYLDIYWEEDVNNNIFQPSSSLTATYRAGSAGTIQQADCFLVTDSIVYTDPAVMDAIVAKQEASGGLTFPFKDYSVQVISNTDVSARSTESFERELGASNYKLTDIKNIELVGLGDVKSANSLLGKYYSNGQQSRHLQLVLNDSNLYPDNNATQMENYTRTSEVYSHTKPYIPRPIYALSSTIANSGVSLATLMGFPEQTSLAGSMNPIGIQLKDDMGKVFQNGNAPIRLFYKKDKTTASQDDFENQSLQYYFVGYMREFMVMRTGKVVVSERA
jgi:hypothetical protein